MNEKGKKWLLTVKPENLGRMELQIITGLDHDELDMDLVLDLPYFTLV